MVHRYAALLWIAALCASAQLFAVQAFAHATLILSEPGDGAVVATSPPTFVLTYNEPVSALVLRLIAPDGSGQLLPNPEGRHQRLEIPAPEALAQGTHALSWRVISLDGHPIAGTIVFSIGAPSAAAPSVQESSDTVVTAALWLTKLVLYLGLFIGIGGGFFTAWIARSPAPQPLSAVLLMAGLVASVLGVGLQGLDVLGLPLANVLQADVWHSGMTTSFGVSAMVAASALLASLIGLVLTSPLAARVVSLVGTIGAGLALALSGHASAASPQMLMRPAVFIHSVSVVFWIGALLPLAAILRDPQAAAALLRFSRAIPWAVAALMSSGIVLAVVQVQHPTALMTTAYGQILTAKVGLVVLLFALAAVNRLWLTPAIHANVIGARRHLQRTIIAETIIVIFIFGLVASWRFTPPPRAIAVAFAQPADLHIHTGEAMADIRFEPGHAGIVRASIGITTGDFATLDAKEVQLTIENKAAGIEAISRPAIRDSEGVWHVAQLPVPQGGQWKVRVDILVDDFHKFILEGRVELRGL